MSDDKLRDRLNRANRAVALLNDEMFQTAMADLEADYLKQWKAEKNSAEKREALWHSIASLDAIRRKLGSWLDDGRLAQQQLDAVKRK